MDDTKWLKDAIDKLDSKIDRLDQRIDNVDVTLEKQHSQLSSHIFRTELAEENIALLREQIKPLETSFIMVSGVLKIIGIVATVAGTIEGIVTFLEFIR